VLFDALQSGPPIAEDDDSGGQFNAMMTVSLTEGTYIIIANSATTAPVTGAYILTTSFQPTIWTPTSAVDAPTARTEHTAVWSGAEMIVWGGQDSNAVANQSGGRYEPGSDSWLAVSEIGAPSPRYAHTSVWTGSEMIVWGGFSGAFAFDTLGDGASYDPVTNLWSPLATTNQPAARTGHTAVWSGTEMLIWGGASCTACSNPELGDGARYNPTTGLWSPISTVNAPGARFNHTAVWTGSRMIMWGGESEQGIGSLTLLNSGSVYDPATDSWTPLSDIGAPSARRCHAAVWSGSEMILFGGQTGTSLACGISSVNSGARYDPDTDTWLAITAAPVASTLAGPAAIWSGDRMITWFDDMGGRYDPVTNVWSGVSSEGAPSGRRQHTLVWSGNRMIVWGGEFAVPLGTGAIYNPSVDQTP
jgi:N-acetylneuraminic acid mutarotase